MTLNVVQVSEYHWKYIWSDEFGTHEFLFHTEEEREPGPITDLKYKDLKEGKNTRIYLNRPDTRLYMWKDNFGEHKVVINCQKVEQ